MKWLLAGENPSRLTAARFMMQAVDALRKGRAPRDEIENAQARMLELQKDGTIELKRLEVKLSDVEGLEEYLTEAKKIAERHVTGFPFEEAVLRLAFGSHPVKVAEVETTAKKNQSQGVFHQLFPSTMLTQDGRISGVKPAGKGSSTADEKEAFRLSMYEQACRIHWPMKLNSFVEPARDTVIREHPVNLRDLQFLLESNPFVPSGRAEIFARGLRAGFYGDFLSATHLLIPQLENSIRQVFAEHGVITSKLATDTTQDQYDLGWLLTHASMIPIFGEDMAFNLRALLIERFGANFRNNLSHGFWPIGAFYGPEAGAIWWLTLRLCYHGLIRSSAAMSTTD